MNRKRFQVKNSGKSARQLPAAYDYFFGKTEKMPFVTPWLSEAVKTSPKWAFWPS
jgi:hypothetical protein